MRRPNSWLTLRKMASDQNDTAPFLVRQALAFARAQGLDRHEAQTLVLQAAGQPLQAFAWLLTHDDAPLSPAAQQQLHAAVQRRLLGEPLGYITGSKPFYGLELAVDPRVLDPRADTETLVDWALDALDATPTHAVLDLGTGSGAIALALQQSRPHWQVHACDVSVDALDVAKANAKRLGLPVQFHRSNWLAAINERFDAIVSNPPYIADDDPHLQHLKHEPLSALTSGADGLIDLRAIVKTAPRCLRQGGWLLLEHGYDQAEAVRNLLIEAGFTQVQSRRDLAGIERCSGGCWQAPPH